MNCKDCHSELVDELFDPGRSAKSTAMAEHLAGCDVCKEEMSGLRKTMRLLDTWKAPAPSPYFDQKMAVLLREEQAKAPAGWLERMRERLLFNTGRQFRPAMVGALALILILGGGGFVGVSTFLQPVKPEVSATVNDLQILDKNDEAIQQMDQLLQDDIGDDTGTTAQPES